MFLRGPGRPADAVAAGLAAQQNDDVACFRRLAHNVFRLRRPDDRADFHVLGDIARMDDFTDMRRRQTDLVAV